MHRYLQIKAKSHEEAIEKSPFFIGQKAVVDRLNTAANSDGTYTASAEFELTEKKEDKSGKV
jgi:hypothetical protein